MEWFGGFPAIRKLDSDYLMLFDHNLFFCLFVPLCFMDGSGRVEVYHGLPYFLLLATLFGSPSVSTEKLPLPGRPSVLEGFSDACHGDANGG